MEAQIKEYLGTECKYNRDGQMIFVKNSNGGDQLLVDVRGWGCISNMTDMERGGSAGDFQDALGEWIP